MGTSEDLRSLLRAVAMVALVCLAWPAAGHPAIHHVAADGGDDANPGTRDAPLRTIKRASEMVRPGDTVVIHEGVYHEQITGGMSGTEDQPIVYEGVDRDKVILRGSVRVTDWIKQGSVWVKYGLRPVNPENSFVMVDEKRLLKRADSAINMREGTYFLDEFGNYSIRLWKEADPNIDHAVDVYELDSAFRSANRSGHTMKKWIVLRNMVLEKFGAPPVLTDRAKPSEQSHWQLDRLTIRYNNSDGVSSCLDHWVVRDCLFMRNRGHGCVISGSRVTFLDSMCADNEWFGPNNGGGCGLLIGPERSAGFCDVRNNTFRNNGAANGFGCGIMIETPSGNNRVEANLVVGNKHGGVCIYGSSGNVVVNNVLVNIGLESGSPHAAAFVIGPGRDGAGRALNNLIAHNTVRRCASPIAVHRSASPTEPEKPNKVLNNLFFRCRLHPALPRSASLVMERNGWFFCPESGSTRIDKLRRLVAGWLGLRMPRGTGPIDLDPIRGADPRLENPKAGDFRLRPDSPLIDSGIPVKEVLQDRYRVRRPVGVAPDIGAHEFAPPPDLD